FSFLYGSSLPEDLVQRAAQLGHPALALADRDGLYGAPRFYAEAKKHGLRALVGAGLTLARGRLLGLVGNKTGYQNLCKLITAGKAGRQKPETLISFSNLEEFSAGLIAITDGEHDLDRLREIFPDLFLEISRHHDRAEERRLQKIVARAREK